MIFDDAPEEEEANAAMDLDEEERAAPKEEADDQLPKWARRMDPSGKRIPMTGLTNCDADETAAQIIDGGIMANIILLYGRYYDSRVTTTSSDYHKSMVSTDKGPIRAGWIWMEFAHMSAKMKLVNSSFLTRRPSAINFFNQKATQIKWLDSDERFYGGRPWEFMFEAIYAMEKIAKMMSFLVEEGFTPDGLAFLKPMAGGAITNEQRAEFRQHFSQFFRRLMKGAFPEMENDVYFRHASDGVNRASRTAWNSLLGVIFAFREKGRKEEWSIVARQCGVYLPRMLIQKINYSITKAGAQSEFGKENPLRQLMPNLGEQGRKEAIASAARDPARRDVDAQQACGSSSKKPRR